MKDMPKDTNKNTGDIIYILTNEAMPDYIKIGRANNLKERLRKLNTTGVPLPFEVYCARKIQGNIASIEKRIHFIFDDYRRNQKREFFTVDPDKARELLKMIPGEECLDLEIEVSDEIDRKIIEESKNKKKNFNFKAVGIPIDAELTFSKNPNQKVTVKSEKNIVELKGEKMSISTAALELLKKYGFDWKSAQGAAFFIYEGETLKDRRERLENE